MVSIGQKSSHIIDGFSAQDLRRSKIKMLARLLMCSSGSSSKLIQVAGRIHFLAVAVLKAVASADYGLEAASVPRGCLQFPVTRPSPETVHVVDYFKANGRLSLSGLRQSHIIKDLPLLYSIG